MSITRIKGSVGCTTVLLCAHERRRDQVLDGLLRLLVLHEDVLRPVELGHINAAVALLRAQEDVS
jgi:hypothetical protein